MPKKDPVLEVQRVRDQLAASFNYDIDAFFAHLQARQTQSGKKLLHPKARKPSASPKPAKAA